MALSKSTRILILLAIDTAFFLLELVIGYSVHSLALVADSFHMLNDVLSLCVGLWAVKVAQSKKRSKMYTYGWQRAETLGALVNGVFLVALCLSIFMEAIQRFFEPQEVSHPKLVLIVGCFGLASNIVGLFLFHEHGHSHGGGHDESGHNHGEAHNGLSSAEQGLGEYHDEERGSANIDIADEHGNIADVLPQNMIQSWNTSSATRSNVPRANTSNDDLGASPVRTRSSGRRSIGQPRKTRSNSTRAYSSVEELYIHPASFRNEIIAASRMDSIESDGDASGEPAATEASPLLGKPQQPTNGDASASQAQSNSPANGEAEAVNHKSHRHNVCKGQQTSGGHSHGDLNMRGVFLHVMGDALGNIGVIASALIIWLTKYSWRFYADPVISLVITIIILASAIPLCKAASRILLQAVPAGINVDDIRMDIDDLPGIISCHHLHVWQLSDTKLVASLHIQVEFDFKGEGSARYMALAREVRQCLHEYGIHSSTIQPEFCLNAAHDHTDTSHEPVTDDPASHQDSPSYHGTPNPRSQGSKVGSKAGSLRSEPTCLLDCGDGCAPSKQCCTRDEGPGDEAH